MDRRGPTSDTLGAWVIKCNPAKTDLRPMVAAGRAKRRWCVATNYRTEMMSAGDRVIFWVSAHPRRGIWGAGRLAAGPVPHAGALEVDTDIALLAEPVTAVELKGVAGLASMEVFRAPQQANPSWVSVDEWSILEPLLRSASR